MGTIPHSQEGKKNPRKLPTQIDKNLFMMKRYFKMSFIVQFVLIVALVVTIYAAVV